MTINAKRLRYWALSAAIALAAYFIYVEVQTRLGDKARAETGLTALPLDAALAAAQASGKPVLVEFSAVWCPTCRRLTRSVFSDAAVREVIESRYIFARVEYESDTGEAFMQRYQVRGYPTVVELAADGTLKRKLALVFDPQEYLGQL